MSLMGAAPIVQSGELTTFAGRSRRPEGGVDFNGIERKHRLYHCQDGWLAASWIGRPTVEEVAAAVAVAGCSESLVLEEAFAACTVVSALDALSALGVPAVRVLQSEAVFHDPWLIANRFYRMVNDARIRPVTAVRGYAEWQGFSDAGPSGLPMWGRIIVRY